MKNTAIQSISLFGTDTLDKPGKSRTSEARHLGRWLRVNISENLRVRAWGSWGGYVLQAETKTGEAIQDDAACVVAGAIANRYKRWLQGGPQPTNLKSTLTLEN